MKIYLLPSKLILSFSSNTNVWEYSTTFYQFLDKEDIYGTNVISNIGALAENQSYTHTLEG